MVKFDFIIGNPPYIRYKNMSLEVRKFLKNNFSCCNVGLFDLYYAFVEWSYNKLAKNGQLVYLIPNSVYKSKSAVKLRNILKAELVRVIDYKKSSLFDNVMTTSTIIHIQKGCRSDFFVYSDDSDKNIKINKCNLNDEKWLFNYEKSRSKSKNKIIVLDCCHSGKLGEIDVAGTSISNIVDGMTILTASRNDEVSIEIDGHGIFTGLLLEALKGGASDISGHITPGSVYSYIDKSLGAWDQRPVFKTNVSKFVSLREVTPRVEIKLLRRLVEFFKTENDEFKLDPSFEFTNSLEYEQKKIEPFAVKENVDKFKILQEFESIGLVTPKEEKHMYFAAMNFKSCELTRIGRHYWKLVKEDKI